MTLAAAVAIRFELSPLAAAAALVTVSMLVMSLIALVAMGLDKRRSTHNARRIPEAILHLFELLGGWPGSYLGSVVFHHKTRKFVYRVVRTLCTLLHLGAVGAVFWLVRGP